MSGDSPPTVRTRRLGLELRRIREEQGYTLQAACMRLRRSASSLSRVETGRVCLPERDVPYILDAYGIIESRRREALITLARDALKKGWWQQYDDVLKAYPDFIGLENDATLIRDFETIFLPGLTQTPAYARALFETPAAGHSARTVKRLVEVRTNRQRILNRVDPPEYHAIIGEAALRQLVGGDDVMRAQYERLLDMMSIAHVTIQVLPFSAGAHVGDCCFTLLRVPALGDDVVHVDAVSSAAFVDDAETVARYSLTFGHLRASALQEQESRALIERIAMEL
jgi:transcriptional regulator with XRE-family HTH domain